MKFFEFKSDFDNYNGDELSVFLNLKDLNILIKSDNNLQLFKIINPTKTIEELSLEEMKELMSEEREDVLEIVYGYLHKDRFLNSIGYAYKNHISERTLFRYVKEIKEKYKKITMAVCGIE